MSQSELLELTVGSWFNKIDRFKTLRGHRQYRKMLYLWYFQNRCYRWWRPRRTRHVPRRKPRQYQRPHHGPSCQERSWKRSRGNVLSFISDADSPIIFRKTQLSCSHTLVAPEIESLVAKSRRTDPQPHLDGAASIIWINILVLVTNTFSIVIQISQSVLSNAEMERKNAHQRKWNAKMANHQFPESVAVNKFFWNSIFLIFFGKNTGTVKFKRCTY